MPRPPRLPARLATPPPGLSRMRMPHQRTSDHADMGDAARAPHAAARAHLAGVDLQRHAAEDAQRGPRGVRKVCAAQAAPAWHQWHVRTPVCSLCMPGDYAMASAGPRRQNCHTQPPHFTKLMCHCTSVESATAGPVPYRMLSETAGASAAAAHMARPCCCAQAEAARAHRHRAARRAR